MMWAGAAWADVQLYHAVGVEMPGGVAASVAQAKFSRFFILVPYNGSMGSLAGEFTLNFKNEVTVEYDDDDDETLPPGEHTFKLWPDNNNGNVATPGDDAGNEISIRAGGESALSEANFSYTLQGEGPISGSFPPVHSVSTQITAKCVPYIELDFEADGTTVKGVTWRFVDPANPKIPLPVSAAPLRMSHINIDPLNEGGYIIYPPVSQPSDACEVYIPVDPISIDNLEEVRVFFVYNDGENDESTVYENWSFVINDDGGDDISGELVDAADLEAVKEAADENLTNKPGNIIAFDEEGSGQIFTGTRVSLNSSADNDLAHTSSIISVRQPLQNVGDAVAFSTELGFALKAKSLENIELPTPGDFSDLKAKSAF
jgi:hypothetical protein